MRDVIVAALADSSQQPKRTIGTWKAVPGESTKKQEDLEPAGQGTEKTNIPVRSQRQHLDHCCRGKT
jgi:hypothetical protein